MSSIRSICVYCGSSPGGSPAFLKAGRTLGRAIAQHGLRLVYGGGSRGIMGAVSDAVREGGGAVTGIIPEFLVNKEAAAPSLRELDEAVIVSSMHERKQMLFERSDAFVALPGGLGTLEEIVEVMTWAQLGRHRKPIVLADVDGFWTPLTALIDHMRNSGFIHSGRLVRPMVIASVEEIVPAILAAAPADNPRGDADIIAKM